MDVGKWLRDLGLGQYEAAFRESSIDGQVLPHLTLEASRKSALRPWEIGASCSPRLALWSDHAQENDAERAVRAALAIQRALSDLNARNAANGRARAVRAHRH